MLLATGELTRMDGERRLDVVIGVPDLTLAKCADTF